MSEGFSSSWIFDGFTDWMEAFEDGAVDPERYICGWVKGYRLVLQGLAFRHPAPIFATWRPNNENEANIAVEALPARKLKVTDVLFGDETFGGGINYLSE